MANFRRMQILEKSMYKTQETKSQHGVDSALRWEEYKLVQPPCGALWQ